MIRQETESGERIIFDSDGMIAFAPYASRFPFEIWVMPKAHSCDFVNIDDEGCHNLGLALKTVISKLNKSLDMPPYNFVLHTAPFRRKTAHSSGYWRTIEEDYHWHIEIMPRLTRVAGFEWGSGVYINPTPPEDAAKFLKEV